MGLLDYWTGGMWEYGNIRQFDCGTVGLWDCGNDGLHCTFVKSVQQDVNSLEKLFLLTGGTKVTHNFRIAQ